MKVTSMLLFFCLLQSLTITEQVDIGYNVGMNPLNKSQHQSSRLFTATFYLKKSRINTIIC